MITRWLAFRLPKSVCYWVLIRAGATVQDPTSRYLDVVADWTRQ